MLFDSLILRGIVAQLREKVPGSKILRAFQTARFQIILELASKRADRQIVLNCSPDFGRIHLADGFEPDPKVNYPLGGVLRRWLNGAVLLDVRQKEFDRVVWLEFANARGLRPQARCFVVLEIMGRHSNLIVLDQDNYILEAAKHVSAAVNRYRQIRPGLPYVPPPDFGKLDPADVTPQMLEVSGQQSDATISQWLRATLQGASDVFRDEVLVRANLAASQPASELSSTDYECVAEALEQLLTAADDTSQTWIYDCPDGIAAYPAKLQCWPECRATACSSICYAISEVTSQSVSDRQFNTKRGQLLQAANKTLDVVKKRLAERKEALMRAKNAHEVRKLGETILANLHRIVPGTQLINLPDPYHEGTELEISLDPQLSAQANAQKYFAKYKKAARLKERVEPLLRAARRERYYLSGLLDQIEQAEDMADLQLLEEEMTQQKYLKKVQTKRQPLRSKIQVQSANMHPGYTLLWGKSGLQNDQLLRMANPEDTWLHTKKTPGGHVLIRSEGRAKQVPDNVLLQAAQHAAWLSKRRLDAKVEVDYTLAKYVHRLKGTPPGYVHYTNQKTLSVRPQIFTPVTHASV